MHAALAEKSHTSTYEEHHRERPECRMAIEFAESGFFPDHMPISTVNLCLVENSMRNGAWQITHATKGDSSSQ